ncbi:MAG TPA: hypothetical protein VFY83_18145 [Anaerolineales bacterium]|nr:hypothetical protein [Anaerolineales bacterium]
MPHTFSTVSNAPFTLWRQRAPIVAAVLSVMAWKQTAFSIAVRIVPSSMGFMNSKTV